MATVAVVGAGSLQGRELLTELEPRRGVDRVVLLSEKVAGTEVPFRGSDLVVEELDADSVEGRPDVVFFTSGAARARRWAPRFVAAGSRVVDLSSAHRLDPEVPLVGVAGSTNAKLKAVPSAASLAAARVLAPLFATGHHAGARLAATLLVPVSAVGQAGVLELSKQTAALLGGRSTRSHAFSHRIAFNLVPEVGDAAASTDGDTSQERSFRAEVRRLWSVPDLTISVTAVRVPVFFGLSMVLSGSNGDPKALATLTRALAPGQGGVKLLDQSGAFPMPLLTVGDSSVLVGRVRSDEAGGFQLFATVDALKLVAECAVAAGLGEAH
jgi:aspartate-semialdehyde dehydrogenase